MSKNLFRFGVCFGAVWGASFVGVRADEKPTFLPPVAPVLSEAKPLGVTSLTLTFPTSSPGDAQKLLDTPVSFDVKDASFMVALDAVLTASGKTCRIECRGVKPMKLMFSAINEKAGELLHSLALAGGCDLYVLPDKLLLSPPSLLLDSEKTKAHPFQVLLPLNFVSGNKANDEGINKVIRALHTRISTSFNNKQIGDAVWELREAAQAKGIALGWQFSAAQSHYMNGIIWTFESLSVDDLPLGEALNAVAHAGGCNVYVLPNAIKVCGPDGLTPEEKKVAVPAFVNPSELPSSAPTA